MEVNNLKYNFNLVKYDKKIDNIKGVRDFKIIFKDYYKYYKNIIIKDEKYSKLLNDYRQQKCYNITPMLAYDKIEVNVNDYVNDVLLYTDDVNELKKIILFFTQYHTIQSCIDTSYYEKNNKIEFILKNPIKNKLKFMLNEVENLDKIILEAPSLSKQCVVYRAMSYNIKNNVFTKDKKSYFIFNNYISTSFTPKITKFFGKKAFYTFILPEGTKGIILYGIDSKEEFKYDTGDVLYEFLIQRGSLFEIVDYSFVYKKEFIEKYNDEENPNSLLFDNDVISHYTLKLVNQKTEQELKESLKKLLLKQVIIETGRDGNIDLKH